jgi:membrane protein DedA with SNARE-associated domain
VARVTLDPTRVGTVLAAIGIDPNQLLLSAGVAGLFAVVFAESGILLGFFLPGDSLLFTAGLLAATTSALPPCRCCSSVAPWPRSRATRSAT